MPRIERTNPGGFCWVELATSDQNDAKRFYSALFGWEVIDSPMGPNEVYTMFKLDGALSGAGVLAFHRMSPVLASYALT